MVNQITNNGIAVPAEVQNALYESTVSESAFLKASKVLNNVTPAGVVSWSAANGNARVVEEGKDKPINEDAKAKRIKVDAIAIIDLFSRQMQDANLQVVDNLKAQAGNGFGLELDKTVAQEADRYDDSADPDGLYRAMDGVEEVSVTAEDPMLSVITALGGVGEHGASSSFVMSTSLLYKLLAKREVGIGSVFSGLEGTTPTIMGLPVYTFPSSEAIGYVGAFSTQAAGGIAVPSEGLITKIEDYSLARKNQIAYLTEVWAAFGISDAKYFRKLTLAEEV